jgi:hypothetical protein
VPANSSGATTRRILLAGAATLLFFVPVAGVAGSSARVDASVRAQSQAPVGVTYAWSRGDGYAGWEANKSDPVQAFGLERGLGAQPGLWIWPTGGDYAPGFAEWRYDAPGTTRIASVTAAFSYRNKLLDHLCVRLGLRTSSAEVAVRELCKPPEKPDSQSQVQVALADPHGEATEFFFQVAMPECRDAKKNCSKHLPALDPLKKGAFARLLSATLSLLDGDAPTVAVSGPLHTLAGQFVNGRNAYDVTLTANDDGAGVRRSWLERDDGVTVASSDAPCDATHRTDSLGGRVCPVTHVFTSSLSSATLLEGKTSFVARAMDAAGNAGASDTWNVFVDRTPPEVSALGPLTEADVSRGAGTLDLTLGGFDPGAENDAASGFSRAWLEVDGALAASATAACPAVACPDTFEQTVGFDMTTLSEGRHVLAAKGVDRVGNKADGEAWPLVIDRTAPTPVGDVRVARFDSTTETATIRWDDGTDPQLADGTDGSGVASYRYRYSLDGQEWSPWLPSVVPEFDLDGAPLGQVVDVEVRAADVAGNESDSASAQLTVFEASEPTAPYMSPDPDPGTTRVLTEDQRSRAVEIARADASVLALLGGRDVLAGNEQPLSMPEGEIIGAHLTLSWSAPVSLETDWPLLTWDNAGTTYEQGVAHFKADNVTALELFVDLRLGKVIQIEPDDGATVGDVTDVRTLRSVRTLRDGHAAFGAAAPPKATNQEGASTSEGGINVRVITGAVVKQFGSDMIFNWDFKHRYDHPWTAHARLGADWPVDLIWVGEADVDKAKDLWNKGHASNHGFGRLWATTKFMPLYDAAPSYEPGGTGIYFGDYDSIYDSDRGVYKGNMCSVGIFGHSLGGHKWHYRVYAPTGNERMYNMTFGYYVVGTSHQDHHDSGGAPCPGDWYGGSERAEHEVANAVRDAHPDWHVAEDSLLMRNWDNRGWIKNHLYDNNGKATVITIGAQRDLALKEAPSRPSVTRRPAISGTPKVGGVLTPDPGEWDTAVQPTYTYRWLACDGGGTACSANGATSSTYTVAESDQAKTLRVSVTAHTPGGVRAARSDQTSPVPTASECNTKNDVPNNAAGAPRNDDFRNAVRLNGSGGAVVGALTGGTVQQAGARKEVDYSGYEGLEDWGYGSKPTTSVWYCWTAPASDDYLLSTQGSPPPLSGDGNWSGEADPPRLGIYTGTSWGIDGTDEGGDLVSGATAWQNKYGGTWGVDFATWTEVRFHATAGTQYLIYVSNGTLCCSSPDHGEFKLTWGIDPDADEDGVPTADDNCPASYNPGQADWNGDGKGDECDPPPISLKIVNTSSYPIAGYVVANGGLYFDLSTWAPDARWMPEDCAAGATCMIIFGATAPSARYNLRAVGTPWDPKPTTSSSYNSSYRRTTWHSDEGYDNCAGYNYQLAWVWAGFSISNACTLALDNGRVIPGIGRQTTVTVSN